MPTISLILLSLQPIFIVICMYVSMSHTHTQPRHCGAGWLGSYRDREGIDYVEAVFVQCGIVLG